MKRIFKYPVPVQDWFSLDLPDGAQVLSFGIQDNQLCIWALVDPTAKIICKSFRLAGTGHLIEDENIDYIGTAQTYNGLLVWHLFLVQ